MWSFVRRQKQKVLDRLSEDDYNDRNEGGKTVKNDDIIIICPLVDREISCVDCMENCDVKDSSIPDEYKRKEDWKNICKACPYYPYN